MSEQSLYDILGVARDADREAIRKAYRKLARQYHPDLNPGDAAAEERFKDVSRAWEVLEDAERRRNYDEFGDISLEAGFDAEKAREAREAFGSHFGFDAGGFPSGGFGGGFGGFGGAPGPGAGGAEFHFGGGIDDLLGQMFGGGTEGAGSLRLRGQDLEASLTLDFLEAVRGGEKRLTLGRPTPEGGVAADTITVRIPPGVDAGGRLRIPGKGGPGAGGGPPGDLHVRLEVRPHRVFRREGRNLLLDLPVTVREAIQGARIEVPTLEGRATLSVPAGTSSGTRLRLRGKGVPDPRGGAPGDLLVRVQILVPTEVDEEARRALDALERFEDPGIRKELFS